MKKKISLPNGYETWATLADNSMTPDKKAPLNSFTVDLEDWYQGLTSTNPQTDKWYSFESRVVPATKVLLDILRPYDIKATFFVLGYVADRQPALIETIQSEGHEIAVHGYWHSYVSKLTPVEFSKELERSLEAIMAVTGEKPVGHRAPYFSVNESTPWAFDVLREYDFKYDSSVFPIRNGYYGFPGAPRFPYSIGEELMEFPLSTVKVGGINWPIAGGFYTRLLPYSILRWAIRGLNQQGKPAILYIHPWELDLAQPRHAVTPRERLTHYGGRRTLEKKLHRLFSEFRFAPLRALLEEPRHSLPEQLSYAYH